MDYVEKLVAAAKVPTPAEPNPDAIEKIRKLIEQQPQHPFGSDAQTIIQPLYVQYRILWYQRQWLDSYREHSKKTPQWADLAEAFLKHAATQIGSGGYSSQTLNQIAPLAQELIKQGCDDPLIQAVILQIKTIKNGPKVSDILESFYVSTYPANVAYLAAYPNVTARDLLKLQAFQTPGDREPVHDLFNIDTPTEMRFLFEHLTARFPSHTDKLNKKTDLPQLLATQQSPPAWLKQMLLASINSNIDVKRASLLNAWHFRKLAQCIPYARREVDHYYRECTYRLESPIRRTMAMGNADWAQGIRY